MEIYLVRRPVLFALSQETKSSRVGLSEKGWAGIFSGGLTLKYNRYDRVKIDLLDQDEFMKDLIKINPQIKVF